jgi:hypothetical protein
VKIHLFIFVSLISVSGHTGDEKLKKSFADDGSLVLCLLTELRETLLGLACEFNGRNLAVGEIIDNFSGLKCPQLIGKPKLFFVLDQGTKRDGAPVEQESVRHLPYYQIRKDNCCKICNFALPKFSAV